MKIMAMLLSLSACAMTPPAGPSADVPPPVTGEAECNAAPIGDVVGKAYTDRLGVEAVRRSGSGSLRLIRPGQAVTMDYRSDRLNIEVDERSVILRIHCG